MSVSVELISGPSVSDFTRSAAEEGLRRHAAVAAGAPYALEQLEGRWVAAIVHQAGPPFGGAPADSDEGAPGPKSEGPDDTAPDSGGDDGSPSDDGGSSDGPPSPDGGNSDGGDSKSKDGKGGEKHEIQFLTDAVTQIAQALGIQLAPPDGGLGGDPMGGDPGLGGPGGPPGLGGPPSPHGGPPGAGGPPGGPGGAQTVMHMKALKPGEVPPGATPASAPAFSSVRPTHPWADVVGKTASFHVSSPIGDAPLADVEAELQSLASEVGHRVVRFAEGRNDSGQRVATAVITQH